MGQQMQNEIKPLEQMVAERSEFARRAGETLQMIATTSEFQFG